MPRESREESISSLQLTGPRLAVIDRGSLRHRNLGASSGPRWRARQLSADPLGGMKLLPRDGVRPNPIQEVFTGEFARRECEHHALLFVHGRAQLVAV